MITTLPFLLSIGAMLCWGVLYIFTSKLSRKVGPLVSLFLFQLVSIFLLLPLLPFIHQPIDSKGVGTFVLLGGFSGLIWLLFLHAMKVGYVHVVVPVTNVAIPIIALLGVLFLNESFSFFKGVVILTLSVMWIRRIPIKIKEIPWKYVIGAAITDTVGFAIYNIAITQGELSYVSIITSSSSIVTVLLSYLFLKEKLNRIQLFGFCFSLAGIILLQLK